MDKFINENFLLKNKTAESLYHKYAKEMPIFDYHCHLSSKDIAENKQFKNITEIWLGGDHYKWRAMRSNGINEKYITGDASDYDKFKAWARTVPYTLGNPLYHWSHLELKRYFNLDLQIREETADEIWEKTNEMLKRPEFTTKELLKKMNVKVVLTTDDAIDDLDYHRQIRKDKKFDIKVLPALRPDKGINIQNPEFSAWINKLSKVSQVKISNYEDYMIALKKRVDFFHKEGCRLADHGIDKVFYLEGTDDEVNNIFHKAMIGKKLDKEEIDKFKTMTMVNLGKMYSELGWTMQLHIGALRNTNSGMLKKLGPDTGFDSIGDGGFAEDLSKLLDKIESTTSLPKTIFYCLNPSDNDILATIIGNFQDGSIPGKLQFGPAWWFNDQKDGIEKHLISLANHSLLRRFVGMTTDSRSFLSYTRHEYFRRVLCNLIGTWAEDGELPYDLELLGGMIREISFSNAKEYFNI